MGQSGMLAVMKDVPIKQRKEEYVSDMVPELRGKRCSHKGCTSYVVMGGVCVNVVRRLLIYPTSILLCNSFLICGG